jgi:hypothetical protein
MIATFHRLVAVDDLPWIIAAEYDEHPGMSLTFPQVQRMWGLTVHDCQDVLDYLTASGMLVHDEDDRYRRPENVSASSDDSSAELFAAGVDYSLRAPRL